MSSHQALRADGSVLKFSDLKGHPVVIVNVASKCGFTHQYAGLQELYDQFKDQGLVVLAFPCNQFGAQEPGSEAEIVEFCSRCQYPVWESLPAPSFENKHFFSFDADMIHLLNSIAQSIYIIHLHNPTENYCEWI